VTVELNHYAQGPNDDPSDDLRDAPANSPVVVLAPSLGTTLAMWDDLADELSRAYTTSPTSARGPTG